MERVMSRFLYRMGCGAVRRRRRVLLAWVVGVIALVAIGRSAGGEFHDTFKVPGVESQQATDLLKDTFPARAGASAQVVLHAGSGTLDDPAARQATTDVIAAIGRLPHVVSVDDPVA